MFPLLYIGYLVSLKNFHIFFLKDFKLENIYKLSLLVSTKFWAIIVFAFFSYNNHDINMFINLTNQVPNEIIRTSWDACVVHEVGMEKENLKLNSSNYKFKTEAFKDALPSCL